MILAFIRYSYNFQYLCIVVFTWTAHRLKPKYYININIFPNLLQPFKRIVTCYYFKIS
nr:MAG TPA: hypothetical protein [Caudoviricetes sp.]